MTIKVNPILLIILTVGIFLLILGMVKSCNNTEAALQQNTKLDSAISKYQNDSAKMATDIKEYQEQSELQDGQISLKENQLQAKDDSLDVANTRISTLLKRHKLVTPAVDTNATTVPNEYIEDCEGCYAELTRGRQMVMSYKGTADSLLAAFKKKKALDGFRIYRLTMSNKGLSLTLRDAIAAAKRQVQNTKPTWKGLITIGAMAINANVPNAIGGGIGYQDKYNRIYTIKYYASEYGGIKQAEVYFPLSFRRKR